MTFFAPVLRIFIVDDHPVVVKGLRALLEGHAGWRVCGEAGDGLQAVEKACQLRPDVAIVDISLPNLNGLEATRRILKQVPRTEVLILTAHDSEMMVSKAMEAGAHGYLVKGEGGQPVLDAVEALSRHRTFLSPKIFQYDAASHTGAGLGQNNSTKPAESPLTAREREVMQLLAEGMSSKEIASALHISVKTAEAHRSNIMRKLEVHSLASLVRYALRNEIIEA
ncbi:MAG TPA: response regulator transcription factor [Terriglobia bacterium]|nr:response regulator transcription factor [Terriglobia bacterium]